MDSGRIMLQKHPRLRHNILQRQGPSLSAIFHIKSSPKTTSTIVRPTIVRPSYNAARPAPPRGDESKMSAPGSSAAGLRQRRGGASGKSRPSSSAPTPGSQGGTAGAFSVRLYNDAAPGFKVGPFFVVMSSIVYLVVVVFLHIWGRLGSK